MIKTSKLLDKEVVLYDIDTKYNYFVWAWVTGKDGSWKEGTKEGSVIGFDLGNEDNIIFVKTNSDVTISSMSWGSKLSQTDDMKYSSSNKLYDFNSFNL